MWRKGSRASGEGRKRSRKREKRQKSGKGSLGRGTNENTKEERSWIQTCARRTVTHIPGPRLAQLSLLQKKLGLEKGSLGGGVTE